jgi:hypothetical protein
MKFRMQNKLVLTLAFGFISVFGFSQNQEINTSQTGMSINHNHTGIVRGNSKSTISTKQQTSLSLFKAEETYEKDAIYANRKPENELVERRDNSSIPENTPPPKSGTRSTTIYSQDFETVNTGSLTTSNSQQDGWLITGTKNIVLSSYYHYFGIHSSGYAISGKSLGLSFYSGNGSTVYYSFGEQLESCDYNSAFDLKAYRPISTAGYENIEVSFDWKCNGEYWSGWVDYGQVGYSLNGGSSFTWINTGGSGSGLYHSQTSTQSATVSFPAIVDDNSNFVLAFRAKADECGGNQPAFIIDNIVVSGDALSGPPSCASPISPLAGASGTAHSGNLAWEAVGGADTYDVYFGTSATPLKVATDQVATTYPLDCLLPETTYYWKVVPKNGDGSATGCATWSFTTDNKLHIYKNDWETANTGFFGTSGASVDGWYANSTDGMYYGYDYYQDIWTVGTGTNAISGKSVGVSGLKNGSLAGDFFDYWTDLGTLYRWIYRPINLTGLRDVELTFRWKGEGESSQDFGTVATSINGGNNWLTDDQGGLYSNGQYYNSHSTIRTQTLTFPDTRNNQNNFQLAFKWNDLSGNGYGGNSTFVVDDIVIKGCPYEGYLSSPDQTEPFAWSPATANTTTTITVNETHNCAYFEWEQSTDNGNTWTVIPGETSVSYTTPSNLTSNTFYRCRVYFSTGCPGAYQGEAFKIVFSPDCTTPIAPTDGSSIQSTSFRLSWNPDPLATSYDVYFGTDNPPATMIGNTANQFYDVDNMDYNTTYYWQILPTNAGGSASGCDVWSFTTGSAPPQFHNYGGSEQLTFNNSAYKVDAPNFRISHSTSTMSEVQIQISDDVTFPGTTIYDGTFTGSFSGENNFIIPSIPTLTPGTTYYARARGKIGENWTDWTTDTYSFTYKDQAELEWHQNMEPQFLTDERSGVITQTSPDFVTIPATGGTPSNPVANPSFEDASSWNDIGQTSWYEAVLSDGNAVENMATDAAQCLLLIPSNPGAFGYLNGDYIGITQEVDLTGIDEIIFDLAAWHKQPIFNSAVNQSLMQLRVIIGNQGTTNDDSGSVLKTYNNPSSSGTTQEWSDEVIDVASYTGTHTIKFVSFVTYATSTTNDEARFYIDNIRVSSSPLSGTITSTPINLSSFYGDDSWNELSWDQTLNGGSISLSIETDNSGTWGVVPGFADISNPGDGAHTIDISTIEASRIRLIAEFTESGAKGTEPELNNWTITSKKDSPLPVTLLYFNVQCNGQSKEFRWATASESNSDYFLILESKDNVNFKPIAEIQAAGQSYQTKEYRYVAEGLSDDVYYRLKQVDIDGRDEEFPIIYSNCKNDFNAEISVYPNPFNGEVLFLNSSIIIENVIVEIYDPAGRIVYKTSLKQIDSDTPIKIHKKLEPGAYILKLYNQNNINKQFVVIAK